MEALIKQDWRPEQISGHLFKEQGILISHESIYLHIYQDKYQGGGLHKHLRCQKKRRKRYGKQDHRGRILNRISIDECPAIVNNKSRIGDWESDTIIGKGHQRVVATLVERKTQYTVLTAWKTKQAPHRSANALKRRLPLIEAGFTPSLMTTDWSLPSIKKWLKLSLPISILPTLTLPGNGD